MAAYKERKDKKKQTKKKASIVLKLDSPQIQGFVCLAGGLFFSSVL